MSIEKWPGQSELDPEQEALYSIAVSLKRIADCIERLESVAELEEELEARDAQR